MIPCVRYAPVPHRNLALATAFVALGLLPAAPAPAVPCEPPEPTVACPNCVAVFVMPDTQRYTTAERNTPVEDGGEALFPEEGAIHLSRIAEWVCDRRDSFVEPSTGKSMPIGLLIHLGDLVQNNEETIGPCTKNECEWNRITQAFAALDACGLRYLTVPGNHDWAGEPGDMEPSAINLTDNYQKYFPDTVEPGSGQTVRPPWTEEFRCLGASSCEPALGRWYLGGGDAMIDEAAGGNRIPADSRDIDGNGSGDGPPMPQFGRHRAGMIESAGGHRLLFLGLEFSEGLRFSTRWPKSVMDANPDTPTVLFNHQGIHVGTAEFDALVAPHSQVFLILNGHNQSDGNYLETVTLPDGRSYDVPRLARDRQGGREGWNEILVFDPDAGEVRVRTVQIDGLHAAGDITGVDLVGCDLNLPEESAPIPEILPRGDDNCIGVENPDQTNSDADTLGDACDNCPNDTNEDQADFDADGIGNVCDPEPVLSGADFDGDGFDDAVDNCVKIENDQCDTDMDGYGNHCDGDFDQSGSVNTTDATVYFNPDFQSGEDSGFGTDMNCSGEVESYDGLLFADQLAAPDAPGPSGLVCAGSEPCIDTDHDGFPDHLDNCTELANDDQCDTDGDGFGNVCDADFDQSLTVNSNDFVLYFAPDFASGEDSGWGTDMDCSGAVNSNDFLDYLQPQFTQGCPGPSGLATAQCP